MTGAPTRGSAASSTRSAPTESTPPAAVRKCAVVCDRPDLSPTLRAALERRSIATVPVDVAHAFEGSAKSLHAAVNTAGPVDAVIVALEGHPRTSTALEGWEHVLADHRGIIQPLHDDASWLRAAADSTAETDQPLRLVILVEATTPAGQSRAQAASQIARVAAAGTKGRLTVFTVGLESDAPAATDAAGELAAHLLSHPDVTPLAGAGLVVREGWIGLRRHPQPIGTVTYGGPAVPAWLDNALREIVAATGMP